ncbi:MAG TPA: hypothetical protein VF695_00610 [Sphingomonas sp.]|jgi:hypothetical protein
MDSLWTLPVALQIALGSGYLAYLVAYAGLRERHTSTEAIFRAIAFGMIATATLTWFDGRNVFVQVAAVAGTITGGAVWRFKGMDWARCLLRRTDISWTDDIPTAWLSVTAVRTEYRPSQIAVDLNDGRTVFCDDTRLFTQAPHGPCVFGLTGDIALYVTAELREDGTWLEHDDVLHPTDGANLTYLPASSIKRVAVRYWTKANGTGAEAVTPVAQAAAAVPEA